MNKFRFIIVVLALAMVGQGQAVELHVHESYSAFYDHKGELEGKGAIYCRDHCNQRVLVMDLKSNSADLLDFKIRVIGGGAVEKSIDFIDGTIRNLPDNNYQKTVAVAKKFGANEAVKTFLRDFGAIESNEMGEFNGYSCRFWTHADFGLRVCFDENMVMVYRHNDSFGKVSSQTLTKLVVGDGGADEFFEVPDGLRVK